MKVQLSTTFAATVSQIFRIFPAIEFLELDRLEDEKNSTTNTLP
jgi:hypothetical protein